MMYAGKHQAKEETIHQTGDWRVGKSYNLHVYEVHNGELWDGPERWGEPYDGDQPVATFHHPEDARFAVELYNIWWSLPDSIRELLEDHYHGGPFTPRLPEKI